MKLKQQLFVFLFVCLFVFYGAWAQKESAKFQNMRAWFIQYKTCLTHPKSWMICRAKELEDVGIVASSFPTYVGKIEATLLAGKLRY